MDFADINTGRAVELDLHCLGSFLAAAFEPLRKFSYVGRAARSERKEPHRLKQMPSNLYSALFDPSQRPQDASNSSLSAIGSQRSFLLAMGAEQLLPLSGGHQ